MSMNENSRSLYLDNLKLFLTVLVIFHHSGQAYTYGSGNWPYVMSNPDELLPNIWHFFNVNAAFFMGLFFFISGFFVPASYDRQGPATFIKKKLLRLGIPLVIMTILLSMVVGKYEVGHMWFVESLLVFCLLYAVIRLLFKPVQTGQRRSPGLLALAGAALVMGLGSHIIRQVSPQDNWIDLLGFIHIEPAHYLQYVMMFIAGVLAYRGKWLDTIKNSTGITCLSIALALTVLEYTRYGWWWYDFVNRWYGFYDSIICITMNVGLLWLFSRFCNHTNRVLKWGAAQSYGAFVFHILILLGLQYTFDKVWMGNVGKFLFLGTLTCILSFGLTWLLRLIPGVKRVL